MQPQKYEADQNSSSSVSGEENDQDNNGRKVGQNSICNANGKDGPKYGQSDLEDEDGQKNKVLGWIIVHTVVQKDN